MDNQLILIIGNLEISWFAVFTAAACAAGVCMACLLRFLQRKDVNDIFTKSYTPFLSYFIRRR